MLTSSFLAFSLYITILVCIGIFATKKSQTSSGFLLGNRGLNYWVAAISANASDMSVWLFMGLPMAIYMEGLLQVWTAIGLILFMFLNWHFIAPKLRRETERYGSLTLFSFFESRFKENARSIRVTGAMFATIFLTIYLSAGITGMGYLFESVLDLNYTLGCALSVVAILIYTSLGGFNAICYTDFFQGLFLLVVITAVPSLVFFAPMPHAHNTEALTSALSGSFLPTDIDHLWEILILTLGWGLGYFGQPHILNKFMAIKNPDDLRKSKWLGTLWQILALGGAIASGFAATYFFSVEPKNVELIFVDMVKGIFNPFTASLLLCAIFAATLSTIDSQVLALTSIVTEDFLLVLFKDSSDKNLLWASRIITALICILALTIALFKISSIFKMVYYCWVGMGSAFGPLVITSLYFKNITKNAGLIGMMVGGSIGALWIMSGSPISAMLPGFFSGMATIYLVSLLEIRKMRPKSP